MKLITVISALVALSVGLALGQREKPVIDTGDDLGKIKGAYLKAMAGLGKPGREYYWFTGIPYAKPESYMGENKFKPSEIWEGKLSPVDENGTFVADETNAILLCPQNPVVELGSASESDIASVDPFNLIKSYYSRDNVNRRGNATINKKWGTEECLGLTISTPQLPESGTTPTKLLPVIFFIHGGSFDAFWGNVFGGQRLLNHDVVLVTINYRLGILGSLNLGIDNAPGNGALYDCITALKWVQKYIHHFGGNKDSVTVTGQSAGAVLATTVFLSPLAKGLFHGVIGDSGSSLSVWANQKNPIEENLKVVKLIPACADLVPSTGLPDDAGAEEILNCMKSVDIEDLIKARDSYAVQENLQGRLGYDAVVPSVQKSTLKNPALTETPLEIMKKSNQSNVPLMMGATRHDGSFVAHITFYDYLVPNGLDSDAEFVKNNMIPTFLKGIGMVDPTSALTHSFLKTYMGDTVNSDDIMSKMPGLIDICTVLGFKAGAYGLVEAHSKLNPHSYYYAFDYKGMFTTYDIANGETVVPGGIAHVDDLLYLFQLIPLLTTKDWEVSERYVQYWVNFATYGNPNGPGEINEPFPRYSPIDHPFLVINETDRIGYHCRDTWIGNSLELM